MGQNTRFEKITRDDVVDLDLTFTDNAPTPGDTATVADGDSPTAAETGQFMADVEAKLVELNAMITDLKTAMNAGEEV